jgi:hypothetical protein
MKLGAKTALGIDISQSRINLVLLKGGAKGVELLKSASAPIPDGAIKEGSIADAGLLVHALRELKVRNKIGWTNHAAISLLCKPVVLQVIDLPKPLPTNVARFAQNEAKRCVALSGKSISFDYCRAGSARDGAGRLLVVATDEQQVGQLAGTCSRAGLNVEAIEPPLIACARALYTGRIAGEVESNLLLATLRDDVLSLCVFRGQTLDFVRTKKISEENLVPGALCEWLAQQMNAVIKFYDFEVADTAQRWEIVVVGDDEVLPADAEQVLTRSVSTGSVRVRSGQSALQETVFAQSSCKEAVSPVAVGLAMRLLDMDGGNLRVNLAPPESAEVRAVKSHALVTANIVALLMLFMIIAAGALGLMTNRIKQRITQEDRNGRSEALHILLQEQQSLERQLRRLSTRPDQADIASGARDAQDWAKILNDIRARTPQSIQITDLNGKKESKIYMQGLSLSYEAVHLFVDLLNKSGYIESASLIQAERDREVDGMVKYSINCVPAPKQKGT